MDREDSREDKVTPLAHLRTLIEKDPPSVHGVGTYGLSWDVAEAIAQHVKPGYATAETGSGMSTLVIAGLGARHLAITPADEEGARIQSWLQRNSLPVEGLSFDHRLSWDALPVRSGMDLDFALIDGCHGFPVPYIDFFYLARNLKTGGVLAIDDVQIWTGRVLMDFLKEDPCWELVNCIDKTVFFRKLREPKWNEWEWNKQPFVVRQSRLSLWGRLAKYGDLASRALKHLLTGDWAKLRRGIGFLTGAK